MEWLLAIKQFVYNYKYNKKNSKRKEISNCSFNKKRYIAERTVLLDILTNIFFPMIIKILHIFSKL